VSGFPGPGIDPVARNAFIESLAVHTRSVSDFLYKKGQWPDDVTAEHYVTDVPAWRTARGHWPKELDLTIERSSERRAGLSRTYSHT
jgi:hypothetical protein